MPSITTISNYVLHNFGPLTSTWTAPASCATTPLTASLALSTLPMFPYWAESCTEPSRLGDCFPSGSAWEERYYSAASTDPRPPSEIAFFSPGAACPSSWTTAGVAVRNDAGELSSQGVFAPTRTTAAVTSKSKSEDEDEDEDDYYTPTFNPIPNILMQALAPGETAVVCCPSGYTAPVGGGSCYSNLARRAYAASTGCQRVVPRSGGPAQVAATFSWNGTTVAGSEVVYTATATGTDAGPWWTARTTAFGVTDDTDDTDEEVGRDVVYTGVVTTPMVTLLSRAGDDEAGGNGDGDGDGEGSGAAPGARIGDVGMLITVWVLAALVGAVVVFPS